MLGPDDRLYFIHIPKTAGTSLIPLIDARFAADEICPAQLWREIVKLPQEQLPQYRLFRGHFGAHGLDPFLPTPPVYMTMLREPLALAYSTYQFVLREPNTRIHKLVTSQNMSFEDFVNHPKTRSRISDKMARNLSFHMEYDPDTGPIFLSRESQAAVDKWVRDHSVRPSEDERLERAKAQLDACAFFGLVEKFDASMALMSYTFNWPAVRQVQKLRVAAKRLPTDDLAPDCRAQLEACNALDIALYAHGCEQFEQRCAAMMDGLREWAGSSAALPDRFEDDPQAVHDVLDQRYRAHRLKQEPTPRPRVHLDFSEVLPGSGWHDRERIPATDACFRWTGPQPTATLHVNLPRTAPLRLTFRTLDAITPSVLDSLRVLADDVDLSLTTLSGQSSAVRVYQAEIPAAAGDAAEHQLTQLSFVVNETLSKQSLRSKSPDTRRLGIAVDWVDVRPAAELPAGELPPEATRAEQLGWSVTLRLRLREKAEELRHVPVLGDALVGAVRWWRGG